MSYFSWSMWKILNYFIPVATHGHFASVYILDQKGNMKKNKKRIRHTQLFLSPHTLSPLSCPLLPFLPTAGNWQLPPASPRCWHRRISPLRRWPRWIPTPRQCSLSPRAGGTPLLLSATRRWFRSPKSWSRFRRPGGRRWFTEGQVNQS